MWFLLVACKGQPLDAPWCSEGDTGVAAAADTHVWYGDIEPIIEQKCLYCHDAGGAAPLRLTSYEEVAAIDRSVRAAVAERRMPPWLPASCCTPLDGDFDLTDAERAAILAWIDGGAAAGNPEDTVTAEPIGGVSRVDLTVTMPEAYTPHPTEGTDEQRCFVLDWPGGEAFITGMAPRPGARAIVHHLIVATVGAADLTGIAAADAADDAPGFDCAGGLGEFPTVTPIGGSLMGGDFPRGLGKKVDAGSKLLLQIHYSTSGLAEIPADQTSIDLRLDDTADDATAIVLGNAAWLVGETQLVEAGDPDEAYWYQLDPRLFTGGEAVELQGVSPHMHRFAKNIRVMRLRGEEATCLLEIPDWEFGWEQLYWFAEPVRLEVGDELYIECHFDNSAANQPPGVEPRDIAWGDTDQDMCVAFAVYTEVE